MGRGLQNLPNRTTPDSDYPNGRIKDNDGSGNGTPVNQFTNDDIHQFLAKMLRRAGITPNGLPENEYSGHQYHQALDAIIAFSTGGVCMKQIEIGDWNMDTTQTVSVPHGIAGGVSKILGCIVSIISDAGSPVNDIHYIAPSGTLPGGAYSFTSTNIVLVRTDTGPFDNTSFDSTSFNRGNITIFYLK